MNENTERLKKQLIAWVNSIEDEDVIQKLMDLKARFTVSDSVNEPKAEYCIEDNFEERWSRGIPHAEMKKKTLEYISNLPWKS